MGLWTAGTTIIVYLSGMGEIPRDYYESMDLDGANSWTQFWHITWPMLSGLTLFQIINGVIASFNAFTATSSYGAGTRSSGVVRIIKDLDQDISGKHVIIVEDIIDTGLTLAKLSEMLSTRNPKSIELCTAFDKPSRRKTDIFVKYKGVSIPDEFIVGYGLDYSGQYRQLDEVYIMRDAKTDLE